MGISVVAASRSWSVTDVLEQPYLWPFEAKVAATALVLAAVGLAVGGLRRLEPLLRRRYGSLSAEVLRAGSLLVVVTGAVYALTVVWVVSYAFELAVGTLLVDRWTAAQQLITVGAIATAYLLVRFVNRSIDKLARTDALTKHQSEVAYHVADVAIAAVAATVVLTVWGIDLTNIFLGAGAVAAIVAVAARETLSAMLAGFVLLLSRPFRVGDWIEVADREGIVTDVTVFNTKIQTFGDEYVLVPNDEITSNQLTNRSKNNQLRVDVEVGVDYDTDLERARSVIVEAAENLESIKSTPAPQVVAKRFGDSAIVLELRVWIGDPTMRRRWTARTDAIEAIKRAFDREGITIPYPQRVHDTRADEGLLITGRAGDDLGFPEADD